MSNQFRILLTILAVAIFVTVMKPIAEAYNEYRRVRSKFGGKDE